MLGDYSGGVIKSSFIDEDEASKALNQLVEVAQVFRERLGRSALASTSQELLAPLAETLAYEAKKIKDNIDEFEEKETFGGEESYWNLFRYFCVEGNRGNIRSLSEIREHLALSYDMSGETLDSLAETVDEWQADIEADALSRFKVQGKFVALESGFVFYEEIAKTTTSKNLPTPRAIPHVKTTQVVASEANDPSSENPENTEGKVSVSLNEAVATLISDHGGSVKQSLIVKAIISSRPGLDRNEVLDAINAMVEDGKVFKFRRSGQGPAYLSAEKDLETESTIQHTHEIESPHERKGVDINLARNVLEILTERGRKPGQMIATSQMINTIATGEFSEIEIRQLNLVVRELEGVGWHELTWGLHLAEKAKQNRGLKRESLSRRYARRRDDGIG